MNSQDLGGSKIVFKVKLDKEIKKAPKNVDLEADIVLGEGGALCDLPLDLQIPRLLSTVPVQGAVSGVINLHSLC